MSKIILSAFADEFADDFSSQIKVLKENNFDMIEPRFYDGKSIMTLSLDKVKELKNMIDDNGLKVSSFGSPLGKINLADDFNAHLDATKKACEIATIFGTKNVRMFSFYLRENQTVTEARSEVIEKLAKMLEIAEEYGLDFCHENEAKIYGESPDNCLDLLKTFNGKLKCVFDMGNFVLDGFKPYPDAFDKLKNYIKYFHIKDSLSAGAIVPAGKGEAQVKEVLSAYKKEFDKDFVITLEPHLQTFSGLNALVGKTFENPYKYENQQLAFLDAIKHLKDILQAI